MNQSTSKSTYFRPRNSYHDHHHNPNHHRRYRNPNPNFTKPKQVWRVKERKPNWLDLPSDITLNILQKVGVVNVLMSAQKVCSSWYRICKDPAMWRVVHMNTLRDVFEDTCRNAVERSQGQLLDLDIMYFGNDELIKFVADRSSKLRRLQIGCCFDLVYKVMSYALGKFPLLEELNLEFTYVPKEAVEVAGRCCPLLKCFKLNRKGCKELEADDELAIAIGENMRRLRQLELIGNLMSDVGLKSILDGCPNLESLDLRRCPKILFEGNLKKRCSGLKFLKYPDDSLEGYEFDAEYRHIDLSTYSDSELDSFDDYRYGYYDYDDYTAYDFEDFYEWEELRDMYFD